MIRRGIVLAGIVVLDIVHIIDHWPSEETLAYIDHTEYGAGGPPHNAGAGLLKLGAPFPVTLLGVAGDDSYGEIMLANARSHGHDTTQMAIIPGGVTSHTHVMSCEDTGRRTFFARLGVNNEMDLNHLWPSQSSAKLYYLGSPGVARRLDETDGWRKLLGAALDQGMKTCLELCPVPPETIRELTAPCLPLTDYFVVNDYEAGALTGVQIANGTSLNWNAAEAACHKLLGLGVREVAAVHHPDGAVAVCRNGETVRRGSVLVPPQDNKGATGAGDAFYAGMLYGLHEDWPLGRCVELGNAAAATSLHSPTTSTSIRPWGACLDYARDCGLRPAGDI